MLITLNEQKINCGGVERVGSPLNLGRARVLIDRKEIENHLIRVFTRRLLNYS